MDHPNGSWTARVSDPWNSKSFNLHQYNRTLFLNTIWIIRNTIWIIQVLPKWSTRVLWFNKSAFWGHFYKTCSHIKEAETTFLKFYWVPISVCWIKIALERHNVGDIILLNLYSRSNFRFSLEFPQFNLFMIQVSMVRLKLPVCSSKLMIDISDPSSKSIHAHPSMLKFNLSWTWIKYP